MIYVNFQSYKWRINYIDFLNCSLIPQNLINYFCTRYYSDLYLYNYHINNENINILSWKNKKQRNKLMYYRYTPQILNNILYNNDYVDIYTNDIFIISLYHHLVLIKCTDIRMNINIDIDIHINIHPNINNVYYLGLYFNHHLYVTNVYWNENKQFCSNNNDNIHEIRYNLILDQQYINSKIDELNYLINAHQLLKKV